MTTTTISKAHRPLTTLIASTGFLLFAFALPAWSQEAIEPSEREQQRLPNSQQRDVQSTRGDDLHADDGSPALGVVVGSCPGEAVCVLDVLWGSPASEAGIRVGDYILSIDGEKVTSPVAMKRELQKIDDAERQVSVRLWRQGQELDKQITLASEGKELPASHRAWLGVMLSPQDDELSSGENRGISIEQVVPGSPADEAGLRSGDVIVRVNNEDVRGIEAFIDRVADSGPETELHLTVRQNGAERSVTAKLGRVEDAPMRFLRGAFRELNDEFSTNFRPSNSSTGSDDMIDHALDEMRRQIRDLEEQVRELKRESNAGANRTNQDGDQGDRSPRRAPIQPAKQDVGLAPGNAAQRILTDSIGRSEQSSLQIDSQLPTFLAQRYDRDRRWYGNRRGYNYNYRHHPRYRNPWYGHSYYRYQGRPYYGHGRNWYGPRGGVRIGPNFGVYWY